MDGRVHDRAGRNSHLSLASAGSPSPASVRPVAVLPATAPAPSRNQCPRTAASRGVVQHLFYRWVRQVEPLLKKLNPQHSLYSQPAAHRSPLWDSAAPSARTTRATAPPAPSPPKISLAASCSCTAQSRSSSPESSVSFLRHSNLTACGKQRA